MNWVYYAAGNNKAKLPFPRVRFCLVNHPKGGSAPSKWVGKPQQHSDISWYPAPSLINVQTKHKNYLLSKPLLIKILDLYDEF